MGRYSEKVEPHIVKEFMIEGTRVRIADNFVVSKEEVPAILKRLSEIAYNGLVAQAERKAALAEENGG